MNITGTPRAWLAAALLCVVAFGAACSDSGDIKSASPDSAVEAGSGGNSSSPEVAIKGVAFVPPKIEVEAGTEVRWVNEDAVDHTVTSGIQREQGVPGVEEDRPARPDGRFDENLPEQGDVFTFTFGEPGTYSYYCDVHAGMTGEITVD